MVKDGHGSNNLTSEDIATNRIAIDFKIDVNKFLIPASKKIGKYQKFGFYCSDCNVYMTGQIQLVMVIIF